MSGRSDDDPQGFPGERRHLVVAALDTTEAPMSDVLENADL
jgi:hypothetical protein